MLKKNIFFIINIIMTALLTFAGVTYYPVTFFPVALCMGVYLMYHAYSQSVGRTLVLCAVSFVIIFKAIIEEAVIWTILDIGIIGLIACYSLCVFLMFCGGGCAMGFAVKGRGNLLSVLCFGALAYLGAVLVWLGANKIIGEVDFIAEYINKPITLLFENYRSIFTMQEIKGANQLIPVLDDLEMYLKQIMAMILPACLIILFGICSYIVFGLGRKLIEKTEKAPLEGYPVFYRLCLPRSMSAVFTVLWVISMFMKDSLMAGAITNIIIVMSAVYTVYGLAVVDFLLRKWFCKGIVRFIIYIAGAFFFAIIGIIFPVLHLPTLLLMLGITDFLFDYRRLRGVTENEL